MAAVVVEREQLYRRKWRFYRRESSEGAQLRGRGCAGVGAWAWLCVSVGALLWRLWVVGCRRYVAHSKSELIGINQN